MTLSALLVCVDEASAELLRRVLEEILAHTYFALIAAIFGPFLLIRLGQQFKKTDS